MRNFLLTAAAAAMIFASCTNENVTEENGTAQLSIKLSGVATTRAIEAPGQTAPGTIQLLDGHIFVINPAGGVAYSEPLDVTQATGTGQTLGVKVAADARIYIIGNIPAADRAAVIALTSFSAIQAATSAMATQADYTQAALANSDGQPAAISYPVAGASTVSVSIKPLISRIELVRVKGGTAITAFTVTGVYVDDYYPSFTYGGGYGGALFTQGQGNTFPGIGDAGTWAAAGVPLVAAPPGGNVWAHNLAAGGLPRFIIRLTGVKYDPGSGEIDLSGNTYYLTVTGYTSLGSTVFERGKIYRVGDIDGITFDNGDIGVTPNPVDVDLVVNVAVDEWVIVTPGAVL